MRRKIPLRCWIRIRIWEYKDREPFDGGCKAGLTCDGHCRNCPAFSMSKFCLQFGRAIDEGLQKGLKENLGILEEGLGWELSDGVLRISDVRETET